VLGVVENMDSPSVETPDAIILSHARSGTHFLLSSLASHPAIHGRGEFILRYQRWRQDGNVEIISPDGVGLFSNLANRFNIGIVMYPCVEAFENLCGPLHDCQIIHLLRNPADVAISLVQMEADRAKLGSSFRAHSRITEPPPVHFEIDFEAVAMQKERIGKVQEIFSRRLASCSKVLSISYEEITNNRQVNLVDEAIAARILSFLRLAYSPLSTTLRKTQPHAGANSLFP
jgi:hypothetical protein